MNTDTILRLLQNAGFYEVRADSNFVYMEDPSCILRGFETFIEYMWIIITIITGILLFGMAVSIIRGAKYSSAFTNLRNLLLIFGALSAVYPIMNVLYNGDLFATGCKTFSIPIAEINKMLDLKNEKFGKYNQFEEFETLVISDSGAVYTEDSESYQQDSNEYNATTQINSVSGTTNNSSSTSAPISSAATVTPATSATSTSSAPQRPILAGNLPNYATADGKNVIYQFPDGHREKRINGTRSWRNSNPGNIRYSDFSKRVGAIGQAGGFSVFPDEATGMYAIEALLRTDSYNKLTIAGAISRYAPPHENDTAAYHKRLENLTGISINKRMADLTPQELTKVANAIKQIEDWKEGTIQRI